MRLGYTDGTDKTMNPKRFIFTEPVRDFARMNVPFTMIRPNYIVMIGDKYYRVLNESERAGTHRPIAFQRRDFQGNTVQGWWFEVQEIKNPEAIKLLNEHRIACLVLNPDFVEEVKKR